MLKGRLSLAAALAAAIAAISIFLIWDTFSAGYHTSLIVAGRGPVFYPRIILVSMLLLALIVLWQSHAQPSGPSVVDLGAMVRLMAAIVLTGLYVFAITQAGFVLSTLIYTALLPLLMNYRRPIVILLLAIIYTLAIWYIFEKVFLIVLPSSPWFQAF